jgi:tRNA nucleotidyltransferase (CCA-adding enzyme)
MDLDRLIQGVQNDPAANAATNALMEAGGSVHVVGGAVRDLVLGNQPKDIDLMVSGLDQDQIIDALKPLGNLTYAGKAFGVFHFTVGGSTVEIAMPRVEFGNTDEDFQVDKDIPVEQDLGRRDFTANAMAVNLANQQVVDPYNGAQDIRNGVLKTVSPTAFQDDPTRLLRGAVANSRFNLQPDADTVAAMRQNVDRLRDQPGDRLGKEMDKLLSGRNPEQAVRLMHETGMLDHIAPEVSEAVGFDQHNPHHDLDVGNHLFATLKAMQGLSSDPDLRMAALLHDIGKPGSFWKDPNIENGGGHFYKHKLDDGTFIGEDHEELGADMAEEVLKRLRYPNNRIQRIVTLVRNHMFPYFNAKSGARKFLNSLGGDVKLANDLLTLREADSMGKEDGEIRPDDRRMVDKDRNLLQQVIEEDDATTVKDLAIGGRDLMAMGVPQGPMIGSILHGLLDMVLEDPSLNTRESLLDLASFELGGQPDLNAPVQIPKSSADEQDWQDLHGDEWDAYIEKLIAEQDAKGGVEQFLPDFKWSFDGQHLDVWPTKDIWAQDHFERTGDNFRNLAQGRIYIDNGKLEIMVWENRGTEALQDQAVVAVQQWIYAHYGVKGELITYDTEFVLNDDKDTNS